MEARGIEPLTPCLQSTCSTAELCPLGFRPQGKFLACCSLLVGLRGLEPLTSRLSGVCSNQLSYKPRFLRPDVSELSMNLRSL